MAKPVAVAEPVVEPVAEPTSVVNPDGSFVENWHENYGEDNKAHLSRYKKFDDFVNSHISQRKKFSKDPNTLVEIPNEHSSDDVKAAWRKANGVPETVDGYEYTLSDELATKLGPLDDKKMAAARDFANKQGWSPAQFRETLDFYHNNLSGDIDVSETVFNEQQAAVKAEVQATLKKEWLGEYDNKVLRANAIMRKYGGEEAVAEFNAQNSPLMAKFLDNVASAMSEDTIKGLVPSSGIASMNIKSQIAEVRSQMDVIIKENPSNYKGNSKFKDLQTRKTELYKLMVA